MSFRSASRFVVFGLICFAAGFAAKKLVDPCKEPFLLGDGMTEATIIARFGKPLSTSTIPVYWVDESGKQQVLEQTRGIQTRLNYREFTVGIDFQGRVIEVRLKDDAQ